MIEGIQVLSQEPIMSDGDLGVIVCIIMFLISVVAALILISCGYDAATISLGVLCGLMVAIISGVIVYNANAEPTGQYRYKVIIDDNVSMTEFHTHYELVGQDGEIFIIRDKTPASE